VKEISLRLKEIKNLAFTVEDSKTFTVLFCHSGFQEIQEKKFQHVM